MALSEDDLILIRRDIGDKPDDGAVEEVYDRLGGDIEGTIDEILETRLATMLASPAQFSIPGEYSQSTDANIRALQEKVNARGIGDTGTLTFIAPPAADPR